MKKILIYLLTIATVLTLVVGLTSCGKGDDELEFTLSDDGTYYIVTGIGEDARGSVVIPSEHDDLPVKEIGASAFVDNISITSITVPDTVETIGKYAFANCVVLESVELSEGLKNIEESAFRNCSKLQSISLPDSLETMGELSFYLCRSMKTASIGSGLEIIPDNAFRGCNSLEFVNIPDGVTSIGSGAFYYCLSLNSISIPASVSNIGDKAFYNCRKLAEITVDPDNEWYTSYDDNLYTKGCKKLIQYAVGRTDTFYIVPEELEEIGASAFYGCATFIDSADKANFSNYYLTSIYYTKSQDDWNNLVIGGDNPVLDSTINKKLSFKYDISVGLEFTLSDDGTHYILTGIGTCEDNDIFIINIYDGYPVTEIAEGALENCVNIESIIIPGSITSIGERAFAGCLNLSSITVDKTNTVYSSIDNSLYTKDGKTLLQYALNANSLSIDIPEGVTDISTSAFNGASNLVTVTLPKSIQSIGASAFENCAGLTTVYYLGDQIKWNNVLVDDNNPAFNDLRLVCGISYGLSYKLDSTKTYYILSGIGECTDSEIVIPDTYMGIPVKEIATEAFISSKDTLGGNLNTNEQITSIVIPEGVTTIKRSAFLNCVNLKKVVIPSTVTTIPNSMFYNCYSLETVDFASTLESIANYAFYGCTNLTTINFAGTAEQWSNVTKGTNNGNLGSITPNYGA